MIPSRETIATALFNLLTTGSTAVVGIVWSKRQMLTWEQVPQKPALCIGDYDEDVVQKGYDSPPKQTLEMRIAIYTESPGLNPLDQTGIVPATQMNNLLDALNVSLNPDIMTGKQTLGGLVAHCWIEGKIFKDPGDLDGQGLAIVPVKILVP